MAVPKNFILIFSRREGFRRAIIFLALLGVSDFFQTSSATPFQKLFKSCEGLLTGAGFARGEPPAPPPELRQTRITNLDELNHAFTHGLIPDLENIDQFNAFRLYLSTKFGRPESYRSDPYVENLRTALRNKPELVKKARFRNAKIKVFSRYAESLDPTVKNSLDHILRSARVHSAKLFMAEANLGTYRKILNASETVDSIHDLMPRRLQKILIDPEVEIRSKAFALFAFLSEARDRMLAEGKDLRAVSQTMVDLIHEAAVLDVSVQSKLVSENTAIALSGLKELVQIRDQLAMELGFKAHFLGFMKNYGVSTPRGLARPSEVEDLIFRLSRGEDSLANPKLESELLVRHLSVVEQPLRSCLGGSDCSSDTYFDFALEPFVHYFTLTDDEGHSNGQMTVVLGTVEDGGRVLKGGFVDKIQNVSLEAIYPMLEAIRQSLAEFGYELYVPADPGDHNGISNDTYIRYKYRELADQLVGERLPGFAIPKSGHGFSAAYSRAGTRSLRVIRFRPPANVFMDVRLDRLDLPWKVANIPFGELMKAMLAFKDGSLEQRMRYVGFLPVLHRMYQVDIQSSRKLLADWLSDISLPHRFRSDLTISILKSGLLQRREVIEHLMRYPQVERERLADRLEQLRGRVHGLSSFLLILMYDRPKFITRLSESWNFDKLNLVFTDLESTLFTAEDRALVQEAIVWSAHHIFQKLSPQSKEVFERVLRGPVGHFRMEERLRQYLVDEYIQEAELARLMGDLIKIERRADNYLHFFDRLLTANRARSLRKLILSDPGVAEIVKSENETARVERLSHRR